MLNRYIPKRPILFDTTLRDGIQMANALKYPLSVKKMMLNNILNDNKAENVEIGSLVSKKVLPIMSDTIDLFNHFKDYKYKLYVLVPNSKKMDIVLDNDIKNISLITSVSEKFQFKNTRQTLKDTKDDFKLIFNKVKDDMKVKLYISCINRCPLDGIINNKKIIDELIYYYYNYKFNELCLSDTCGSLQINDFRYIITCLINRGILPDKLSLHLHINEKNIINIQEILYYCFENGINKFDVSILEEGGCSVTMTKSEVYPNLSYELIDKYFNNYSALWKQNDFIYL
jgi:isopropylmalate/homocitrate/citramalate synthase